MIMARDPRETAVEALAARIHALSPPGADTSDGSVGADRQRAVVALESEIEAFERKASAPSWLSDAAEALGECRPEDGAPLALNWTQVIAAIHELREDRDHWKLRAERAEYTQESGICYAPLLSDPRPCGLARGHAGEHRP